MHHSVIRLTVLGSLILILGGFFFFVWQKYKQIFQGPLVLWLYLGERILRYLMYLLVVIASGMIVQQNLANKICKMVYMHQMLHVFQSVQQSVQTFAVKD